MLGGNRIQTKGQGTQQENRLVGDEAAPDAKATMAAAQGTRGSTFGEITCRSTRLHVRSGESATRERHRENYM